MKKPFVKKLTLLLFFFLFNTYTSKATVNNNDPNTSKLENLCKIWGFLKYYHPKVAKGEINWDEELIKILPKIEKANTREEYSKLIADWINSLGTVKVCKSCNISNSEKTFEKNFSLRKWMSENDFLSNEVIAQLKHIESNRFQGNPYYVQLEEPGNIKITHEPEYKDYSFPEANYRLLNLFRVWNIVEYFYPYKFLTDKDWHNVLTEMIPKFENSQNVFDYHMTMLEFYVKIDDGHGIFKTKETISFFGKNFVPVKLKIIENKAVIRGFYNDSLSKINDLRIGDVIEEVEGSDIKTILEKKWKYINGSNNIGKLKSSYYSILNGNTNTVLLKINRNGVTQERSVNRYSPELAFKEKRNSEKYKILENKVGYLNMELIGIKEVLDILDKLKHTEFLIFDFRGYPQFLPYNIVNCLGSDKKEFAKLLIPDLSYPGKFLFKSKYCGESQSNKKFNGKIVLLVNEDTQSRGEYAVMCMQTIDNVITLGSQTAGSNGDISKINFIGNYTGILSGLGVFYPDETIMQRQGVKIDYKVTTTLEGIRTGRDEILEKALEILLQK